ncbi:MAG: glutamate--tRNA ligase [Lachnospiraceae bacterium]|nr:glutamate--tRNA ligase [Lachnospiraceae bacterium]
MKVRTRFAPSPTGYMHIGNLRTALYAYLIAKHENGDFLLRIEDTDKNREVEGAIDIIYNSLKLAGLKHDEGPDIGGEFGPYVQSERVKAGIYMEYAKKLVEEGAAYYCFCDEERLSKLKKVVNGEEISFYDKHCLSLSKEEIEKNLKEGKPFVIRQNNPTTGTTTFNDILYGDITVDNSELDDMILIKSDGYPTYNFANVVDDHLMNITHVVRGNEYLSSAPKYNRLYDAFGWAIPKYIHCPPITDETHHKLSKRHGAASFEDMINLGLLPECILNFVALLGWSPDSNEEIFDLNKMIELFDYKRISKSPAVLDMQKLRWMNGKYIEAMDDEKYLKMAMPYVEKVITKNFDKKKIALCVKTRIEVFPDIVDKISFFENVDENYDKNLYINEKNKLNIDESKKILEDTIKIFENETDYSNENLFAVLKEFGKSNDLKVGKLMWPIRIALSGLLNTPAGATEIASIIGKDETVSRIKKAISIL